MDLAGRKITNATGALAFDEWYVGLGTATTTNRGETGVGTNSWWNITSWQHDTTVTNDDTTWANAVVGDFNGDGRDDIAGRAAYKTLANGNRPGEWWVSYTSATVGTKVAPLAWTDWNHAVAGDQLHWRDVQAADFNGDGTDDILGRTRFAQWHLIDGATGVSSVVGTWGSNYTEYPVVVAGDFTGDGKIDLAARWQSDTQWHLSEFTAGGGGNTLPVPDPREGFRALDTSRREDFMVAGSPQGVLGSSLPLALLQDLGRLNPKVHVDKDREFILGRYNADGRQDWEGYGGAIPFNESDNVTNTRLHLDFNGDNVQDLVMQTTTGQWYVGENFGNSYVTFTSNLNWSTGENRQVLIGDFTGDGKDDLLSQKTTGSLSANWYLHASRGDGTFTSDLIHTRTYTMSGDHVWLLGGQVGDFDNDGRDDVAKLHRVNPGDSWFTIEVVFSNGVSPTPAVPTPVQPSWTAVNNWLKQDTSTSTAFKDWEIGVGDFNNDGADDVWGMQKTMVFVPPPMMTAQKHQVWVGFGSGRGGGMGAGGVYTLPEFAWQITPISAGSKSGRFDSSADLLDDIVLEIMPSGGGSQLRVIKSAGWSLDLVKATSGRSGGEQFAMVGDQDHDGSDDLIWIGTTATHNIDLFVRSKIETIYWVASGEPILNATGYVFTTSTRLRKRKPN